MFGYANAPHGGLVKEVMNMGMTVSPEIWGMVAVASCFGGWVLGNLSGASRAGLHNAEADGELVQGNAQGSDAFFSLKITPKILQKTKSALGPTEPAAQRSKAPRAHPIKTSAAIKPAAKQAAPTTAPAPSQNSASSQSQPKHREVFMDMPSINEVRAQARQILETDNVWNAPDTSDRLAEFMQSADRGSVKLLTKYRSSIEELQRSKAGLNGSSMQPFQETLGAPAYDLPRLADVAPLSPQRPLAELACRMEERAEDEQSHERMAAMG